MQKKYNGKLVPIARTLRKNMTKEERHLWYDFLRGYDIKFVRQKIFGRYIADFYCASARLIVELDGSQHYTDDGPEKDAERTAFLEQYEIKIIRIPNSELNQNFRGVCEFIDSEVKKRI